MTFGGRRDPLAEMRQRRLLSTRQILKAMPLKSRAEFSRRQYVRRPFGPTKFLWGLAYRIDRLNVRTQQRRLRQPAEPDE